MRAGEVSPNKGKRFPGEALTPAEIRALLAAPSRRAPTGIRNRALMVVMYRTGLRISEALALRPSDINAERGTVRVLHGKGDQARTVAIDDGAVAVVQLWLDTRRRLGFRNGPLFCTLDGKRVSATYVRSMMGRMKARAGIDKRVHPHGLRHTHAAELAAEGVPVNVIQKQLGHAWLSTTAVYLDHIAPGDVIAMGRGRTWAEDAAK
jgi:site-specific recombinase XerD